MIEFPSPTSPHILNYTFHTYSVFQGCLSSSSEKTTHTLSMIPYLLVYYYCGPPDLLCSCSYLQGFMNCKIIAEVHKCRELPNSTVSQVPKGALCRLPESSLVVQTSPDYAQKITHNSEKHGCKDAKKSNRERGLTQLWIYDQSQQGLSPQVKEAISLVALLVACCLKLNSIF